MAICTYSSCCVQVEKQVAWIVNQQLAERVNGGAFIQPRESAKVRRKPCHLMQRQRSSLVGKLREGAANWRETIRLTLTTFALVPVVVAIIVLALCLGMVLASLIPLLGIVVPQIRPTETKRRLFSFRCGLLVILKVAWCALYLCCVAGWPFLTTFQLGPSSPEAVAVGHCVCFAVLTLTIYVQLLIAPVAIPIVRLADWRIREDEITHLESHPFWYVYILLIFLDWYQYSALSFSVPELKFPPSVQDLLEVIFSLGLFKLPFVRADVVVIGAFIAANAIMCALSLFGLVLILSPIWKWHITSHMLKKGSILDSKDDSEDEMNITMMDTRSNTRSEIRRRINTRIKTRIEILIGFILQHRQADNLWSKAAAILPHKYPRIGPGVVFLLQGADARKWKKEFDIGMLFFTGCLVSLASANLRLMACSHVTGNGQMMLVADNSVVCWTPSHSAFALIAGLFLTAYLPLGLVLQVGRAGANREEGIRRNLLHLMLEQPLKLLTVGVAIQSEAVYWTRARLIITLASAAGIALASTAVWSTNHRGLNRLWQLAWSSACIGAASSWIHFEANGDYGHAGLVCFLVGHALLASGTLFFNSGEERILMLPSSMRMLRLWLRLFILLVLIVAASTAGFLPQLLSINTGAYLEKDLPVSDNYAVVVDSCAIFLRTTNCSACSPPPAGSPRRFANGVLGGRVKVWGSGRLDKWSSSEAAIVGTQLDSCELWLLLPSDTVLSIHCRVECTVHAEGVFARTSVSVSG